MIQRKQCRECGAHTYGRACSVCGSVELERLGYEDYPQRRFSRRSDAVSKVEARPHSGA
jgi:hypothetical protein